MQICNFRLPFRSPPNAASCGFVKVAIGKGLSFQSLFCNFSLHRTTKTALPGYILKTEHSKSKPP